MAYSECAFLESGPWAMSVRKPFWNARSLPRPIYLARGSFPFMNLVLASFVNLAQVGVTREEGASAEKVTL